MMEQVLSPYLGLCTQVYDLSKPTPPADAYAFYHTYASAVNGPIFEPMCGTGRLLLQIIYLEQETCQPKSEVSYI
jgi:hypothetical protein